MGDAGAAKKTRVEGIDVARGLASLIMIQGHAYHGWVDPAHHDGAYAFTRLLGTLPLPAFLVMAGAAVVWRLHAARERDEDAKVVRRALGKRGLQVLLYGYLVSFAYAAIDGSQGSSTLLRVDVLHVIGLSIAAASIFVGRAIDPARFALRCLGLGVAVTAFCPWLADLDVPGSFAPFVGLFVDAPPYTLMPFVPLFAWFSVGSCGAAFMLATRNAGFASMRAGTRGRSLGILLALGLAMAVLGTWATSILVAQMPGTLSRAHPAVWGNVIDLAGRGLLVLASGAALSLVIPGGFRRAMVRLGRGSLVAYIVHVPFCYGKLGGPMVGGSTMGEATLALIPLVAISWASVYAWDAFKARARRRSASFA